MPPPSGLRTCDTCGLPYQVGRKTAHDLKGSHRIAASPPVTRSRRRTVTDTTTTEPKETFGARMARQRREKAAQAEQRRAPANPDADAAQAEQDAAKAAKPTAAQRRAAKADAAAS